MKYLLNETEEQIFLGQQSTVIDLLAVLFAGAIIGLLSGMWVESLWIIIGSVCMLILGFLVLGLLGTVMYQAQRREFDV